VAHILSQNGFDARVVVGGFSAWQRAGYPIEEVPQEDVVLLPRFR
jgi:rhodanese-related sulfurtransferase